jgi:hypothetical protein
MPGRNLLVRSLVRTVLEQAKDRCKKIRNLLSHYTAGWQVEAADGYASAPVDIR